MEKKASFIGITSFHESISYGAFLQCFALQTELKKYGYSSEFINYKRKNASVKVKTISIFNSIKLSIFSFIGKPYVKKQEKVLQKVFFDYQNKYLLVSNNIYNSIEELYINPPYYDAYLTGSDQVWNPNNNNLPVYGLGFVPNNYLKIAYAPSIGVSVIPDNKKAYMYSCLSGIDVLSCREDAGSKALEELLKKPVHQVLDPTMLLEKEEWYALEEPVNIKKPYLLCYFLGSLLSERMYACEIAKMRGLDIIDIPGNPIDYYWGVKKMYGKSPFEFLWLFNNANYVCTDSFHGTAFSINFNKQFSVFMRRGYNSPFSYSSRIISILKIFSLTHRIVNNKDSLKKSYQTIKYEDINKKLSIEREQSVKYLVGSLKSKI